MLLELHELHQIPDRLVALLVSHLHIVVVQVMHRAPVVPVTNTDNYDAEGQSPAFYQQVLDVFLVVDDAVSQNQQNHVFLLLLLHVLANLHGLAQERSEVGGPRELQIGKTFAVSFLDA